MKMSDKNFATEEDFIRAIENGDIELKTKTQIENEASFNKEEEFSMESLIERYDAILAYSSLHKYAVIMDMEYLRIYHQKDNGLYKVVDWHPCPITVNPFELSVFDLLNTANTYLRDYISALEAIAEGVEYDIRIGTVISGTQDYEGKKPGIDTGE